MAKAVDINDKLALLSWQGAVSPPIPDVISGPEKISGPFSAKCFRALWYQP